VRGLLRQLAVAAAAPVGVLEDAVGALRVEREGSLRALLGLAEVVGARDSLGFA
jgi:hypothetical protein